MITEAVIIAFITGGLAVISNIIVAVSNNAKTLYRIEQLEKKVEKHNNLVERVVVLEQADKAQWRYIDQFKDEMLHGHNE